MKKVFSRDPIIIKCKNVNRTVIRVSFFCERNEENVAKSSLLLRCLNNSCKKYKNISIISKKKEELSIMDYYVNKSVYNSFEVINFFMIIPKKGIIDDFSYDKAFEFLSNMIFVPYVDNKEDKFNDLLYRRERKYLLLKEKDYPYSVKEYTFDKFLDFCDPEYNLKGHYSLYLKALKKLNNKDSYDYYLKNIKNNNYVTYIYGNLDDKDELINSYKKYFKCDNSSFKIDVKYTDYLSVREYKDNEEVTKYNQTVLYLSFQIDKMTKKDKSLFDMLYFFLYSKENDLLYSNLRNKNNLIYTMNMIKSDIYGLYVISVYCKREDVNKVCDIIYDVFNLIKNEDNFNIYKERLIKALYYDMLINKDDFLSKAKDIISKNIGNSVSINSRIKIMKKITFNDMKVFLNRVILTRKMTFIGGASND